MTTRAILFGALVFASSFAISQDTLDLQRKYAVGDKDSYAFKISLETPIGAVDVTVTTAQTVAKVYDNGDADIETEVLSTTVLVGGRPRPEQGPIGSKTLARVDKYGVPVPTVAAKPAPSGARGKRSSGGIDFAKYLNIGSVKQLKVGQTVTVESSDPQDPAKKVKLEATLDSIANGVAKVVAVARIVGLSAKPIKIQMANFVDVATGKTTKSEGTITGIASQQMTSDTAQFTMARVQG